MNRPLGRTLLAFTVLLPVLACAAWVGHWLRPSREVGPATGTERLHSGPELVAVFFGATFCGASRDPRLPPAVREAQRLLRATAKRDGEQFATVGVALDWRPGAGLQFLRRMGSFDEIITGHNWLSTAAIELMWRDHPGSTALPQMVVLRRSVTIGPAAVQVGADEVVERMVGVDGISAWVAARRGMADSGPEGE